MRLARYSAKAIYVPGKYLVVDDTLSWKLPTKISDEYSYHITDKVECYVDVAVSHIAVGGRCYNLKNGKEASEVTEEKFIRMRWGR